MSQDLDTGSEMINNVRQQDAALLAEVHGEIDLHNSPDLRGHLMRLIEQTKPKKLILNLKNVPYMDSSAIAVLVESLQKLRKDKGGVYLTDLQPRVKGLLEIARLETIFNVCASETDALAK